jgi:peptide/nickel transport system permease protein
MMYFKVGRILKQLLKVFWGFVRYRPSVTAGVILVVAILALGFVVSLFAPYDPRRWNQVPRDLPPSPKYLLGTNSLGQDIFWLMTWSIRNSLILGVIGSIIGLLMGASMGLIAGYKGGITERLILLVADTFIVIPGFPILILISTLLRRQLNVAILGLMIAFLTWGMPVRNVRSMILSLRERDFTYTSLFSGFKTFNIVTSEYIPYVFPWMAASFMSRINMAIGMEVTLAVFGLSSLQEATLGTMIYWALKYQAMVRGLWWWIAAPVITVVFIVLSLYLVSIGVAEYLNPRTRLHRIAGG